jgi:glycerophosphoryl diester phosphodiesterase
MQRSNFMNITHRGASAYAPENTFAAFDKALALGASHVELDVHFSRDGHIVVIHDDTVDRTTDGSGPVASKSLAQLQSLDAGGWFSPEYTGQRIPTLGGLLERYKGRLHFHIEIKANAQGLSQRIADLVRGYGVADSATITSFHLARLEELQGYAPDLPSGWLVREMDDAMVAQGLEMGLKLLSPHAESVTPELVNNLHRKGFIVRAWGAGNEELMRRVVDAGADGLTVNFPDKLAEYLKAG